MLPTFLSDSEFFEQTSRTDWPNLDAYKDKLSYTAQLLNTNPFEVEYMQNITQQDCDSLDCKVFIAGYEKYISERMSVPSVGFEAAYHQESLCLADHLFDKDKTIDIWRMKEYGDPESWVKQFSISNRITFNVGVDDFYSLSDDFLVKPIASRKNGEILWRVNNGILVSYDIATEKIE
ncbi:hypothetical protein BC332_02417 [Capsicum chinense]|nr:hypothetical protein BC332_02417 [Capsicum chinense]